MADVAFRLMIVMAGGMKKTDLRGEAKTLVAAPPDRVYQLVSDVTKMGEWSPECYRCSWLDGVTAPAVGARFRGYNRRGWRRWSIPAEVTAVETNQVFAFETISGGQVQTRWRYELEPGEGGTILRESFEVLWHARLFIWFFGGPRSRLAQMEDGVRCTLQRIKAAAETDQTHN